MGKLLAFSMNYIFTCKFCSVSGLETYRRTSATLNQMCITTIANLQRKTEKDGVPRYLFSIKEVIQFIESYWESITTLPRKQTNTWHSTILKTLQTHQSQFTTQDNGAGEYHYGLVDSELTNIKPLYEKAAAQKEEGGFTLLHITIGYVCIRIYATFVFFFLSTHTQKSF
jgi:Set1/Ash2 histone methyltransferase complex subunit ASH2